MTLNGFIRIINTRRWYGWPMKFADKLAELAEGDEELEEEHGNFLVFSGIDFSGSSAAAAAELERTLVFPSFSCSAGPCAQKRSNKSSVPF